MPLRYMPLISADEAQVDDVVSDEGVRAFNTWMDDLVRRGVIRAHEGLEPSRTATTVRVRDGRVAGRTVRTPRPRSTSAGSR